MKLRTRITIEIPDGQLPPDANPRDLKRDLAPSIERAVASSLPNGMTVDTVKVTRINIAKDSEPVESEA